MTPGFVAGFLGGGVCGLIGGVLIGVVGMSLLFYGRTRGDEDDEYYGP